MTFAQYVKSFEGAIKTQEDVLNKEKKVYAFLTESQNSSKLTFVSDLNNMVLHWGIGVKSNHDWVSPLTQEIFVNLPISVKFDQKAAQSNFYELSSDIFLLEIEIKKDLVPKQLNYVYKRGNTWFNNNGKNYGFNFKSSQNSNGNNKNHDINISQGNNNNSVNDFKEDPNINEILSKIIDVEGSKCSWTLMHRFNLCNEYMKRFGTQSQTFLSWIFIWMRYSGLGRLTWQRNYNTKPSEMAHSQKNLSFTLTNQLLNSSREGLISNFHLVSLIMSTFGKGGDNGQKIRDQILEIMHRNHVPESHGTFYEQWHQKLHNNTTPDDVGICEAVIAFNKTNEIDRYREVLQRYGITKERLASFERPITTEPTYQPNLVGDLTQYLETLNSIHSGDNLMLNIKTAYKFVGSEAQKVLDEISACLNDFDKIKQMERVLDARKLIAKTFGTRNVQDDREILYLDLSLQAYVRQITESIIHLDLPLIYLIKLISLLLGNLALNCNYNELELSFNDWTFFTKSYKKTMETNREHTMIIKASVDRMKRILGSAIDIYTQLFDEKAKYLGNALGIDAKTVELFTEEVIRNSIFFVVSLAFKKLDGFFKKSGIFPSCNIISNFPDKTGKLVIFNSIAQASPKYYEQTVLLVKKVSGEEEIPMGVTAIISSSELDVLAHISIRARNSQTLLITCPDEEMFDSYKDLAGKIVKVEIVGGKIKLEISQNNNKEEEKKEENMELGKAETLGNCFILREEQFSPGKTGYKSINCAVMRKKLPEFIGTPYSAAFPFGVCEYILNLPDNNDNKNNFNHEMSQINLGNYQKTLENLKRIIRNLRIPPDFQEKVLKNLKSFGFIIENQSNFFSTLTQVWASKFNERVYLSTLKNKLPFHDIRMSVLCQNIIPATYAFVLHTRDPINNQPDQIYGELVLGLGETLVSAYEGRAFSFIASKTEDKFTVLNFPNKSVQLKGDGVILRSDSNCEDLKGFAGAGLFDSVMIRKADEMALNYSKERIVVDESWRREIMRKMREAALCVEMVFDGVAQDIEGVILEDKIFVVQSRPQI